MNRSQLQAWGLMGSFVSAVLCAPPIAAQVIPDATLPAGERSQVTGNPNVQIDGGARRGGNLFHSFSQFSIPTGGSAFFNNAANVQNIFSRVTGGAVSNIDGLIRANGTANLFLMNPNGILFGPNASLNLGGSFAATTANAIGFPNGEVFSSDATQPLPSQLLTVNPNALFFNQLNPKPIVYQSTANETGLQVLPRQNLMLVGGPIQVDSGQLISPGSYVELGGIGGLGTAGLSTAGEDWQLAIAKGVTRADVSIRNESNINVRGASGSIRILAQTIDISRSQLRMGISSDSRSPDTQTGELELNATSYITSNLSDLTNNLFGEGTIGSINLIAGDTISLDDTFIFSILETTGIGKTGNVNIVTGSFFLTGGASLAAVTYGQGDAGSVNIDARDVVSFENNSSVFNLVLSTGVGNAGGINITTKSLFVTGGSFLDSSVDGRGNAGAVNINARDLVSLDGYDSNGDPSSILNIVDANGIGNAGDINITTGSLFVTRGASLYSFASGPQGNAGNVNINARDIVSLDGENPIGAISSSIFTQLYPGAVGQGGDVNITTGSLFLTNGGAINTANLGGTGDSGRVTIQARDSIQIRGTSPTLTYNRSGVFTSATQDATGNGGDVIIITGSLSVSEQGRIITDAEGQGNAGNIQIRASDTVSFDGGDAISTLSEGGVGRGGDIAIEARSLSVLNNAQLSASTSGDGNAGNITASADSVNLSNGGQLLTTTFSNGQAGNITVNTPDLQLSGTTTGLFAQTTTAANAGDLTIQPLSSGQSVRVNLQDGAQISASTSSSGRGGTLTITAPESVTLTGNGSVITAETGGTGTGGNLFLTTGDLSIQDQAEVTVSSSNTGSAGSLFANADRIYLNNGGRIRADTSGGGGDINLRSPFILLRNGSNISTNARGANIPGGNINIDTRFLIAVPNEDSNISANSRDFRGGNVSINAFSIFGIEARLNPTPLSDITATGATSALPGTIDVTTAGFDPTAGLVVLPTDLAAPGLIAQGCPANQGNSFVITGHGGLPPNPEQQLDDDAEWQDRRRLTVAQQADSRRKIRRTESEATVENSTLTPQTLIIEATGWETTPTGNILLTATSPTPAVQNPLHQLTTCLPETH